MKYNLILTILLLVSCQSSKLTPDQATGKLGEKPYFEIDGEAVSQDQPQDYNPNEIAALTSYFDKEAVKLYGKKAKDGAVIIETKKYATNKYIAFFKESSNAYRELVESPDNYNIQYLLNDRVLTDKKVGVSITSKRPGNLYNSKEKFK